jgi:predicted lysophospholipase L1 biosynthesis ABC-type transport system permease subunit
MPPCAGLWAIVAAMNASLRLGWRTLWRDLRAGELRLLIVAVTLAVAALTAVGFFADRLKGGLRAMRASCWAATRWW